MFFNPPFSPLDIAMMCFADEMYNQGETVQVQITFSDENESNDDSRSTDKSDK